MSMKRVHIYISAVVALVALMTACQRDTTTLQGFEADCTTIEAPAAGGDFTVAIRSDKEWTAVVAEPWLMVSPANGRGQVRCIVKVDSTLVNDIRQADIRFSSSGEVLNTLHVEQAGYAPCITPDEAEHTIAASAKRDERWLETEITTNVEFDVVAEYDGQEEWLTIEDYHLTLDRGARPRTTRLHLDWRMNTIPSERTATLHLLPRSGEIATPATIVIRQEAAPLIEDNRQGDSLAVITIFEKLECWSDNGISTTEGMHRWGCLRLWEATDEALPEAEAVGRVRDLDLSYFNTEEGIPQEIKYLKYLETLSLFGNVNTMLKSISLGEEVTTLAHLKALRVAAYGISELPESLTRLGATLETLDLNSNNLERIPKWLTSENFPKLKSINLSSNRRAARTSLQNMGDEPIGLYTNMELSDDIERLLRWESLEELALSYNYIEGSLPDLRVGDNGIRAYTEEDIKERGDTLRWAVDNALPRVLPNMRSLRLNLNFMTGRLPDWLLYHPRLMEWGAEVLIFQQQESATDSKGRKVQFDNVPGSFEYYFERYPLLRGRFEFNDELE